MSAFTDSVERCLRGVFFFSPGAMAGCPECDLPEGADERAVECASEGGFSWSQCDSCGSSLGGNRYPAHGFLGGDSAAAQQSDAKRIHCEICVDCLMFHAVGDEPEEWGSR